MNDELVKGQLFALRSFHVFRLHLYINDKLTTHTMSTVADTD